MKFPAGRTDVTELFWQIVTSLLQESGKLCIKPTQQVRNENIFDSSGYYLWKWQKIQLPGIRLKRNHLVLTFFWRTIWQTFASTVGRKMQMTVTWVILLDVKNVVAPVFVSIFQVFFKNFMLCWNVCALQIYYRYAGSTMHVLEGQRWRTSVCVQRAEGSSCINKKCCIYSLFFLDFECFIF